MLLLLVVSLLLFASLSVCSDVEDDDAKWSMTLMRVSQLFRPTSSLSSSSSSFFFSRESLTSFIRFMRRRAISADATSSVTSAVSFVLSLLSLLITLSASCDVTSTQWQPKRKIHSSSNEREFKPCGAWYRCLRRLFFVTGSGDVIMVKG